MMNTQNEVKYTRITLANLLISEINTVKTAAGVDIGGLLLLTASNSILLISLNVLFKLMIILSINFMMYTVKFEPRMSCLHATTLLDDSKPLR